jgi:hypothetical protein
MGHMNSVNHHNATMFHTSIIFALLLAPDGDIVVKWKRDGSKPERALSLVWQVAQWASAPIGENCMARKEGSVL